VPILTLRTSAAIACAALLALDAAAHAAGERRDDAKGIAQVYVPAGCFLMGSTPAQIAAALALGPPAWVNATAKSEQPQHEVCLTSGYWLDRTEVTNAAYAAFVADGGYDKPELWSADGRAWLGFQNKAQLPVACEQNALPDHPRVCVTWYEAEAYATWRGGRLPTEAQWEFAARGPSSLVYPWGNDWDAARANVVDSAGTTAVGTYPDGASWVGALDLAGNAMEWVQDWLSNTYYSVSPKNDPTGSAFGVRKVEKGGWWGSNPYVARGAYRHFEDPPEYQDHHIGFRIVSSPSSPAGIQGLWWNAPAGSESGWGLNFAHQGDTLFATWFTYDGDGKAWWLVAAATKSAASTYTGKLYTGTGPAFDAQPFDPAKVVAREVGTATFTFAGNEHATFAYVVDGVAGSKEIVPQVFASAVPRCTWGAQKDAALATNMQDIWWAAPAQSESGWGINFTHQGDTIFATWFTFGRDGKPLWLVVAANKSPAGTYSGNLYTAAGSPFSRVPFDASLAVAQKVGTTTLTFHDGNSASFDYTVTLDGKTTTQSKALTRQAFSSPRTLCE
jgi:formylglycine-generating enzyme required for sulfatase activity